MAKDYVEDNEGQGFASFDDDGPNDLESLLAGATSSEEQDDEDTSSFFTNEALQSESVRSVYTPPSESPVVETSPSYSTSYEETPDRYQDELPDDPEPIDEVEPYVEPYVAPVVEEAPKPYGRRSWEKDPNPSFGGSDFSAPAPSAPVAVQQPTPATQARNTGRIHIPSENDQISIAKKTIRIVDAYRALNDEVRMVASQFITSSDEIITDEATLVVKVLNADPMLGTVMKALREAKNLDPVERVFYVIDLRDDVLHSLGDLVKAFTDVEFDTSASKINYARNLVREIDQLESHAVNYVESTESILAAAGEESN